MCFKPASKLGIYCYFYYNLFHVKLQAPHVLMRKCLLFSHSTCFWEWNHVMVM